MLSDGSSHIFTVNDFAGARGSGARDMNPLLTSRIATLVHPPAFSQAEATLDVEASESLFKLGHVFQEVGCPNVVCKKS